MKQFGKGTRLLLALIAATVLVGFGGVLGVLSLHVAKRHLPAIPAALDRHLPMPSKAARPSNPNAVHRFNSQWLSHELRQYPAPTRAAGMDHGGGLFVLGDEVLVLTARGDLLSWRPGGSWETLGPPVPMDRAGMLAALGNPEHNDRRMGNRFRATDLVAHRDGDGITVWASHSGWDEAGQCVDLRLSRLRLVHSAATSREDTPAWQTLARSQPCLPLRDDGGSGGIGSGGKLVLLGDKRVLWSVGDYERDGLTWPQSYPQDPTVDYGKVLLVDLETGDREVFVQGLRNPQGLTLGSDGKIWETEHGPNGGDELNLLVPGSDYGWPTVSYGRQYALTDWPANPEQGRHDGFAEPRYAWVPSIGVSNLIEVRHGPEVWRGDLLVGSLRKQMLYRLHIRDERVVLAEPIPLQHRLRDLAELSDGTLVFWTDRNVLLELRSKRPDPSMPWPELTAEETALGLAPILANCQQCHALSPGERSMFMPNLWNVVGRTMDGGLWGDGRWPQQDRGDQWTEARLTEFLLDPQEFSPGIRMPDPGLDENQAQAVARYLARLRVD